MSNYNPADLDAMDAQDMAAEAKSGAAKPAQPAYSKAQILASTRYSGRRDALSVALQEGRHYTEPEIELALKNYYKKEVK